MKYSIRTQIAISIVCLLLAFVITLQFKSVKMNTTNAGLNSQRAEELQVELIKEKEKNSDLLRQIIQYQTDLDAYRREAASSSSSANALLEQLNNAEILAGITELEGKGVVVTLTERAGYKPSEGEIANNSDIVHDDDIRLVVSSLLAAGAEGISINGQRIIATTAITCVGPVVQVNFKPVAAPFEIMAIGDSAALESALNMPRGVADVLSSWGIDVTVKKTAKITLPRYDGYVNFKYATPVLKGGDNP